MLLFLTHTPEWEFIRGAQVNTFFSKMANKHMLRINFAALGFPENAPQILNE